jgi:hypothetical protein
VALVAGGGLAAARAWQGRDWVAMLAGEPFPVRITDRRTLHGRAGPLHVLEGEVENLSGAPKGFFEVRGRLIGSDGRTLAERQVYAGRRLADAELKGLSRAELERRLAESVFGDGMANARVEPRKAIAFQIVFVGPPAASRVAEASAEVVAAKDVP